MMTTAELTGRLKVFFDTDPQNFVSGEDAISPDCVGARLYDAPLLRVAAANDPLFEKAKENPAVVGAHFMTPGEWLPGAKSVVSVFFPFTRAVRESNRAGLSPSALWLHGRIEGQKFVDAAMRYTAKLLREEGAEAVVPALDSRFAVKGSFSSNWSERHVAYIAGLGTFSLTRGLITEKGMAGRFGSVVTSLELLPDRRPYDDPFAYCIRCGMCARRCPARAISLENGKLQEPCRQYVNETRERYAPRYGCGKCQTGVPCEAGIPKR